MIKLTKVLKEPAEPQGFLSLPMDKRVKSRLRTELTDGREVGLFLPRGLTLRGGDLLSNDEGFVVQIVAADEGVSTVRSDDMHLLARICYHLGNRHVPLQVEMGWVRYTHDHVLDDMVRGLGAEVTCEQAPFEPETGAYGGGSADGHSHGHSHSHGHGHHHH